MTILKTISDDVDSMNDFAVRKWLKRYMMAMFLIKGRLHRKGFDPDTISGEPQEMVENLKIKLQALSEFSVEIAEIMKKYGVAYTGDTLNQSNSIEENKKSWMEYFEDRVEVKKYEYKKN